MAGYIYGGEGKDPGEGTKEAGTLDRLEYPSFCEAKSCSDMASWRIAYQSERGEFCPRHTVSLMRNRRLWLRRPSTGGG